MRKKTRTRTLVALATLSVAALAVWALNSSYLATPIANGPQLLAHRGLGQAYSRDDLRRTFRARAPR